MDKMQVNILGHVDDDDRKVLTQEACRFLATLHNAFEPTRRELLEKRVQRQKEFDAGTLPDFLAETRHIRDDSTWRGAIPGPGLADRRVEITGPTDRKMVVNALNSGVYAYMADFEDSNAPTWKNMVKGQVNLFDAIRRQVNFTNGQKEYKLRCDRALPTLICRSRGWHLDEKHFEVGDQPIAGALFDFGLYFFHNAKELISLGTGPYFYIPKIESHLEARLWNDVYNVAQDLMGIPRGTIRGTVLIETITAAFEMDEIIYELRDHIGGLNCGRWDYIFTYIKAFRHNPNFVLPDRSDVTMAAPFMDAYVRLLIATCHRRGIHAMGGMSAAIPIKGDTDRNAKAMASVRADKIREAVAGHDGTWVAHPALAPLAQDVFNQYMPTANNIHKRTTANITRQDLLNPKTQGNITAAGVKANVVVCLVYMEAWLRGIGCSPINFLMVTKGYVQDKVKEEAQKLAETSVSEHKFDRACEILLPQVMGEGYAGFLTELLYDDITSRRLNSIN